MKTIAVLSGKGGVGKSSITASLAVLMAEKHKIVAVDCDVDAPNLALVLGVEEKNFELVERVQTSERAKVIEERCNQCEECLNACKFSAMDWDEYVNLPRINKFLCTGCGACTLACSENAIKLESIETASIKIGETEYGFTIVFGQLDLGESGSGHVVNAVKIWGSEIAEAFNAEYMIVDAAAGIGCPVIASVRGSNFVILITEPTPAAFSDLKRAIELVNHFNIPHGVIINRFDINNKFTDKIEEYFKGNDIPVLGKIPYNRKFVDALVNLKPIVVFEPEFTNIFLEILEKVDFQMDINNVLTD
ncbi:MAG: ATP-binding protein [Methanobacterium sp.]|nr:ATP-binding protein [Methanobacterium sp.]